MGRPIYQGANSVYAVKEGMYVKRIQKPGIDTVAEAVAIAKLILRDYRRGWTYDDDGSKIPMDETLFRRRLNYLITLAHKHGATPSEIRTIEKIVDYVAEKKRLPRQYMKKANKMIVKIKGVKIVKPKKPRGTLRKKRRRRKKGGFLDWLFG